MSGGGGRGRKSRHGRGGHGGRRARKPRPGSDAGGGGGGHGGGDSRWMVTYADMLTLLMVLFLVLWVLSTLDLAKFEKFKSGLGDFGNPAATAAAGAGGGAEGDEVCATADTKDAAAEGDGHSTEKADEGDGHSTEKAAEPDPCLGPGDAGVPGAGGGTGDGTAGNGNGSAGTLDSGDLPAVAQEIQEAVNAAGFPDVVSVSVQERGLVVIVTTDNVLFGSGAADITGEGAEMIGIVASTLNEFTNRIVVEGHTDKRPLRREGYDNWDLSVDRAVSVIKLLRDQYGIDSDRLTAAGFGERRPIAEGDDEASLARNRRVEIVVLAQTPGDYTTDPDGQATASETPAEVAPTDADPAATEGTAVETATG
jgi:chemotaxis protein MotB